jgi:hypothetical protein
MRFSSAGVMCVCARLGDDDNMMVGCTEVTNVHIFLEVFYLANKPTSKGVRLKVLSDASMRVMIPSEFVEVERARNRYAEEEGLSEEGLPALVVPWHNEACSLRTPGSAASQPVTRSCSGTSAAAPT